MVCIANVTLHVSDAKRSSPLSYGSIYAIRQRPFACALSGIPGRAQTCSLRFWRPLLHHLSYGNIKSRPWNRTSRVYTHAPRSKLRSGGHIKTAPVRRRGCWLAHILSGKLHLGKDSKAFSWHGRLHVRPCGLSSPCAIRCDTAESNRLLSLMSGRLPLCQCIA